MNTFDSLSPALQEQIREKGISETEIQSQLERFRKGFPTLNVIRPATIGDGIIRVPDQDHPYLLERYRQAQKEGRTMKFVPASGAASRMFKTLQSMLNSREKLSKEYFEQHPEDEEVQFTKQFLDEIASFAFYDDLNAVLEKKGTNVFQVIEEGSYKTLLSAVLDEDGLALGTLPKALIPFHAYPGHARTPMEEHIVEAIEHTKPENGDVRIHFTISPEHEEAFYKKLEQVRSRYENESTRLLVETSFQKPETDTIAATPDNEPFLDENGQPVFRPGGHGALLANLEELKGDLVYIKNIDNIVPDRLKKTTYYYKKLIGGYLLALQDRIFHFLKELDSGNNQPIILNEITEFIESTFHTKLPESAGSTPEKHAQWLFDRLNCPLRVCIMVKNEEEPGGGPFFVQEKEGSPSLQIVEDAQINHDDPVQKKVFQSSTHFNPTDLVCSLRDFRGKPFNLKQFRNPDTGFISVKSYEGKELKALELPGLWNGSMAYWNSVFVEAPANTFNPVKTVNDLLRDEHRNE
ncbi:DUF4301 family protein [Balneolaceae bacterium ANBcel3]|nr:DUF4301 family protein [Balneolaceae bacterium ANBcel3]